jgi:hypothetical protein
MFHFTHKYTPSDIAGITRRLKASIRYVPQTYGRLGFPKEGGFYQANICTQKRCCVCTPIGHVLWEYVQIRCYLESQSSQALENKIDSWARSHTINRFGGKK